MACRSKFYRPPKPVSKFKQLGAAPRGNVASQIQNPLQFASAQIQNSNAPSKEEISLKETSPKQSQIKPVPANPDAWGRFTDPHNIAFIRLNGLEIMTLLDTGAQIFSISKLWV